MIVKNKMVKVNNENKEIKSVIKKIKSVEKSLSKQIGNDNIIFYRIKHSLIQLEELSNLLKNI